MRGRGALLAVLALLAAALVPAAGCEERAQDAPAAGAPAAALTATADYGAAGLLSTRVAPGQSVMRALRGATDVRTAYAGGFVDGMLGRDSDPAGPSDWFFFVDGISSGVGAKDVTVADGADIWWDYRDWGTLVSTPAVVGAWPAPLAPADGPARTVAADPPLAAPLAAAGATITRGDSPWRARVGASDALAARDPAWRRALGDPDGSGLTVTIDEGRIVALDPDDARRDAVPGARALAAAVPTGTVPEKGVLVVVAGLDDAAAQAAARTVAAHPEVLARRYALAFDGAGNPLRAGGREGP